MIIPPCHEGPGSDNRAYMSESTLDHIKWELESMYTFQVSRRL